LRKSWIESWVVSNLYSCIWTSHFAPTSYQGCTCEINWSYQLLLSNEYIIIINAIYLWLYTSCLFTSWNCWSQMGVPLNYTVCIFSSCLMTVTTCFIH
jgi:hypothetical protein